ncbi:MAG: hypothetical protein CL624_13295 [Arcobacter sp.]|nr:hypothetical protein [Arcobacter sp.]|tara:strand:- start:3191 stop:3547 length:357 start_codon:yes stop_codon:yes gene_type:complete
MKKRIVGVLVVLSVSLYASNVPNILQDYKLIIELIDDLANKIDLNEETLRTNDSKLSLINQSQNLMSNEISTIKESQNLIKQKMLLHKSTKNIEVQEGTYSIEQLDEETKNQLVNNLR